MPVTIQIPTALRGFTDRKNAVPATGATVAEALADFTKSYPDIRAHLYDENGALRSFINVYVNGANVKKSGGLDTPLAAGDTVMLVPAIAGGAV
ncbi:MAG: MoaD/ThiS family protein [Clostridiales bacterium]|jgi:MoaD family protein|nr:MoaD/ThiS family protein [Clostridiales bacterium]